MALAVVCALLAAACDSKLHDGTSRPGTAKSIVGRWTSEPWAGQSGYVTNTFCFSPDGKYTLTHSPASAEVTHGTYTITGESVTFTWAGGQETEQMRWEGDILVLTTGERAVIAHLARRYHRNGGSCE